MVSLARETVEIAPVAAASPSAAQLDARRSVG